MSFYWALVVSQFFDIKRKDFWQMFVHHVVTLLLLSLSWICNLHRVGSLVLVIHDCADIFLEAAKITKYANYQKLCDAIFGFFTIIWIVTRLGFYPRVIYSSSVEAPQIVPMFPAYYIFNSMLLMLLLLHFAWTYMILQIVHSSLKSGKVSVWTPNVYLIGINIMNIHTFGCVEINFINNLSEKRKKKLSLWSRNKAEILYLIDIRPLTQPNGVHYWNCLTILIIIGLAF